MHEENMEETIVWRTVDTNLKFIGTKVAWASNRRDRDTRWTEIEVYRTLSGKYVFALTEQTLWAGELDYYSASVFPDVDKMFDFLKNEGPVGLELTKELADKLGYDLTTSVD